MIMPDWYLLIWDILPSFFRIDFWVAYFEAHIAPVSTLSTSVYDYYTEAKVELRVNSQTIVLERALNRIFPNPGGDPIYIDNINSFLPIIYIFGISEGQPPLYVYSEDEGEPPLYTYSAAEYESDVDFNVYVSSSLVFDEDKMRTYINKVILAGKKYSILTY